MKNQATNQPKTILELLRDRAQNQPEQTIFTFLQDGEVESNRLTYGELDRQARSIASLLQNFVKIGELALLVYPPGLDFITAFFGCLYAGVVAVPAYPPRKNQKISRIESILRSSQATIILTTASELTNIKSQFIHNCESANLQYLATDNIGDDLAQAWQEPIISNKTLAFLQYTSGSTSTPKGVMISHGNILENSAAICSCFGHSPNSQGVIWLPPYHDMGLIGGIIQPLYVGFPVTLMPPIDFLQRPLSWLRAISHYKATTSGGPNFAYELCIQKITESQRSCLDLSSWEVAFTGAEPIRAETLKRFANTFASCGFRLEVFYPCYGMAEATLIVAGGSKTAAPAIKTIETAAFEQNQIVITDKQEDVKTIVGVGQSLSDQKIVIVDPESFMSCRDGQVGEIWVSGSSVAQGYWNQSEETEKVFHAHITQINEESFLRTGDLGFLLDGELFITGRLKDIILIRGQNHYPQDIELTVEQSHPALRSGCGAAFAVNIKGEERLVIVHEVERSYMRKLNVKEVVESIRKFVVQQHNLYVYSAVLIKTGSIPKTSSGKIQRYACQSGFITGSLNVVDDLNNVNTATR
jgi:acyl-CoA synthetase (AMP-forming)/AMP-acid ligase II